MALVRFSVNALRVFVGRVEPCGAAVKSLTAGYTQNFRGLSNTSRLWCQKVEPSLTGDDARDISTASKIIPVETSIQYIESKAYQETYGSNPVWKEYRRNHKGAFAPPKTRKTCIRQEKISTGNPCPICRDEYLVLDYRNVDLLKQFICPHTGSILSYSKTGLCQKRHQELIIAVQRARDCGNLTYDVPHRVYDYSEYIKQ